MPFLAETELTGPIVIVVYLTGLVAYGAWHSRRIKTQEDFALAGRSLTVPVLVGTMVATWIGTGSLVGNAEKTYQIGLAMLIVPFGGAIGLYILSLVAKRVRRFGQFTVQDILEARFGIAARILATAAIITAYLTIVSYQYRAGGAVIHTIFPELAAWCNANFSGLNDYLRQHTEWTDSSWGSILAAMFIIGYTVLGGLVSVAYTDVINGLVMTAGILIGLPILLSKAGGISGIQATFAATPEKLQIFGPIGWLAGINLILPAMLLVMGEANLYQRFFAAKDSRTAGKAAILVVFGVFAVEMLIILLAFVSSAVETGLPKERYGHVILLAAQHHLPTLLGALVLAAAVAIIVSTADSFLLVSSNSVVRDIYQRFMVPGASPRSLVTVSRIVVVVLGLVAFYASVFSSAFLDIALWAYTVYGASITPALLATFFWKRATATGAALGIAGGTITTIVWKAGLHDWIVKASEASANPNGLLGIVAQLDAVLPAMAVSILLLVGGSLLTPPPPREKWEPFAA